MLHNQPNTPDATLDGHLRPSCRKPMHPVLVAHPDPRNRTFGALVGDRRRFAEWKIGFRDFFSGTQPSLSVPKTPRISTVGPTFGLPPRVENTRSDFESRNSF